MDEMNLAMEQDLTIEQNLCAAKLFLSMFDLLLEEKTIIDGDYKFRVLKDNSLVGMVYVTEEIGQNKKLKKFIKIDCQTSLGKLTASYEAISVQAMRDIEYEGSFAIWSHNINYNVDGPHSFNGSTQIDISIDTHYPNRFRVHTQLDYLDNEGKKVKLRIQEDTLTFSYIAKKDEFKEVLEAEPYNIINGFDFNLMYHSIQDGKINENVGALGRFRDEMLCFIGHNGMNDKNHLKFVHLEVEDYEMKHFIQENTILKLGADASSELAIQCGMLMHESDPSFSKKIKDIISYFKVGDVSFLRNLLDISFHDTTDEERRAIFGFDILKLKNPIYIYFGSGDFLPNSAYHKSLENKRNRN